MRLAVPLSVGLLAGWVLTGCHPSSPTRSKGQPGTLESTSAPIPGTRSCFWARGPYSGDPYINIAYPDSNTFYWVAAFTVPAGAHLEMDGLFPHSRYMSFISYDQQGRPVQSIADYLIQPDAGSTNPFQPGAQRNTRERSYHLSVIDGHPPANAAPPGVEGPGTPQQQLSAPSYGPGQKAIIYRIYATDHGSDDTGGVGLPQPKLTMPDGKVIEGPSLCSAVRAEQPLASTPDAASLSMQQYAELLSAARKVSPYFPASDPSAWYEQLDREGLYDIYLNKPLPANAQKSVGGFFPNLDNQYIRTIVNRKLGQVFVVRAKAPRTPKTLNGDATMGTGELRYWSWCSNQGFANTRVNKCVEDEQIPVDAGGDYTLVLSRPEDRPRNAQPACGVAWLPMAEDGDGSGDADMTVLQLRHMLAAPDFSHSIQAISKPSDTQKVMGPYYPSGHYMNKGTFESLLPCFPHAR